MRRFIFGAALLLAGLLCLTQAQSQLLGVLKGAVTPVGPTVTWNPSDTGPDMVLTSSDLVVTKTTAGFNSSRATLSKSDLFRYFEVTVLDNNGALEIGAATTGGSVSGDVLTTGATGFAYRIDNNTYDTNGVSGGVNTLTPAITTGDVVGVLIKASTGEVWLSKNGSFTAFSTGANPATGTNPALNFTIAAQAVFPLTVMYAFGGGISLSARLAASGTFVTAPPSGAVAWNL